MNAAYTPTRPVLRIVFIAIAGIATLSTGVAIDGLACTMRAPPSRRSHPPRRRCSQPRRGRAVADSRPGGSRQV